MSTPSEKRPPIPVKIVVSGGFGVGKTTTVRALSEIEPLETEAAMTSMSVGVDHAGDNSQKTTTTVAMDFGRVTIDSQIILYMFGTPGQDRFGFMWKDLADGALGGVVLVDPSRIADSFTALDYFDTVKLPYVVAVNSCAGRTTMSLEKVREALDLDPEIPVVPVDAREKGSVKNVVLTLIRLIITQVRQEKGVAA